MLSTTGQRHSLSLVPRYEEGLQQKRASEQEKLGPMDNASTVNAAASKRASSSPPPPLPSPLPLPSPPPLSVDVNDALSAVGLEEIYGAIFRYEEIDLSTLPLMREHDFVEIGVKEKDVPVLLKLAKRLAAENVEGIKSSAPKPPGNTARTSWVQAVCHHREATTLPAVISPIISPVGPTKRFSPSAHEPSEDCDEWILVRGVWTAC